MQTKKVPIPCDKLSKKAKRALDQRQRGSWGALNPMTRKSGNKMLYNRKRTDRRDDYTFVGSFVFDSFFPRPHLFLSFRNPVSFRCCSC